MYNARNKLLGEKENNHYTGKKKCILIQTTNREHLASQSPVSPCWPCSLQHRWCSSHFSLRQVCKTADSASSLSASIPTPLLPPVRCPHVLQTLSLLLVSVLTLQHLSLHCAANCGADDKTSDMSYFSWSNSSLTSRGKWLDPGSYTHTFSSITAHRKSNSTENHCTSLHVVHVWQRPEHMDISDCTEFLSIKSV